ncbi:MexH family multidrug efflux RND transporter periplasmic adaptor subunit [Pedobacter quisquiliarum]|jgi:membrane fusion protein (multidrug efflux system)|uniref:MexH family multidrug efflux RND transporter periplasmic adaptor subunit n=1 Tax=Pedobacter quisquiliarum TaxID=1834438 RepID=A0A916UCL0_9SPHI|nr:efflux RND transporter periplasmic adaptor subunit [Pedobacter quisquiliarum]GGC68761.1 MexH family multidrug efflux RND transporter periplasmic adaptor subunit [Pedobacter quisquiliarum]
MKIRYIIYAVLALALAYFIYYRITANKAVSESGKGGGGRGGSGATMVVNGIVVEAAAFENELEVTGSIEANEAVNLQSEISGLVTSINFTEGSNVKKGTVLVRINDRDIQAQLQQVLTGQKLSQSNENRAKQLLAKGAISQEEYDTSLAELQSLNAQAQLVRAQLAKAIIRAPFDGKIGLRNISMGEYLTPNKIIASLSAVNPVKISFSVPEKYSGQIKVNSEVDFNTDGLNQTYKGKVYAIEPGINAQTRTLSIKALAQNPKNDLLPGSFAKIRLTLNTMDNALLIPNEAIIPVLKGKTVFISENGKAKQVPVESGTRTADRIVITSGLKAGDTVLTTGAMALKNDAAVKVTVVNN